MIMAAASVTGLSEGIRMARLRCGDGGVRGMVALVKTCLCILLLLHIHCCAGVHATDVGAAKEVCGGPSCACSPTCINGVNVSVVYVSGPRFFNGVRQR